MRILSRTDRKKRARNRKNFSFSRYHALPFGSRLNVTTEAGLDPENCSQSFPPCQGGGKAGSIRGEMGK